MFKNREEAGKLLAKELTKYGGKDAVVLGIPRGGLVVAHEVAKKLELPLDVIVIKKIGYPGNEELAAGAVGAEDYYLNEEASVPKDYLDEQIKEKQVEAKKRYEMLRRGKKPVNVKGKIVIVVDDGVATGSTMRMAVEILREQKAKKIIVGIPVAPPDAVSMLRKAADEVVCLTTPEMFMAIGQFYEDFMQVSDEEAKGYL